MRLLGVATATLSLLLIASPALRAQDQPAKPEKETKKDDKKTTDEKKDDKKKDEKGDEGDDDDDKPKKDEKLPFNPFAKAKKGDWSSCVGQMKVTVAGGGGGMNIPDQKMKMKFLCKITKVTDDEVTVSMKQSGTMGMPGQEHHATFSLKENPSLTKFFSMDDNAPAAAAGPPIAEWKVEDDKKTVGGKEFTCKKYTGKLKDKQNGGMGMDGKLTLWITDTTKGWGLIAMTMKGSQNAQGMNIDFNMDVELKGYGNGDTADFGKKPADEGADDEGDDDGDDAPKAKDKKDDDKKDDSKKDDSKKDDSKKDKKKDDSNKGD